MSIYDVIKDDHRKVEKLFAEIKRIDDPDKRYDCFDRLKEELLAHAKAEQKHFYDKVKKGDLAEDIGHAEEEHHDLEAMLAIIQDLEPSNKTFMKKVADLEDAVNHHVREEEREIMPKARKILGDDASNELARQFQREKRHLQQGGLEPAS